MGFVPCTHAETWASGGHDTFQHGASQVSVVHFQEGGERMEGGMEGFYGLSIMFHELQGECARAAIKMYHRLGALNNRNLLSPISAAYKSKIKVLAGLGPSQGCDGESVPCSSPCSMFCVSCLLAPGGLLAIFGVPWLVEAFPQSLLLSPCGILPECLSVSRFCRFIRTPIILD